jgi:type II secretory ATPase GspE/PulE/Tfp pilus assembly ATPase PilB-like protein
MGIEPYLVASSLEMVLAQRLVRLICPDCKTAYPVPDTAELRAQMGDSEPLPEKLYHGTGCRSCLQTGYHGRKGIFEMMPVNEAIRAMILERASAGDIRRQANTLGMKSLRQDGLRLVRAGKTTLEEILRATKDERWTGNGNGQAADQAEGESPETANETAASKDDA